MTLEEFSNGFDTLVSSYRRFKDFDDREILDSIEFDEYEKSFFLTKAQEEVVLSLYNGKNPYNESFEYTEELRRYLANLIEEERLNPIETTSGYPLGIESSSKFFTLPEDLWFITYEAAYVEEKEHCDDEGRMDVVPVTQDEYHRIRKNPFRGPNNRRVVRLDLAEGVVELVSKYTVTSYYVRYLKKLSPIILEELPDGLTIENDPGPKECKVHQGLHQQILEMAVMMALRSKLNSSPTKSEGTKNKENS